MIQPLAADRIISTLSVNNNSEGTEKPTQLLNFSFKGSPHLRVCSDAKDPCNQLTL